jgi:hypothetical protein
MALDDRSAATIAPAPASSTHAMESKRRGDLTS